MERSIFSIILLNMITGLHCKHYLVEVDNVGPVNTNLEESDDEAAAQIDVQEADDKNEDINEMPDFGST